MSRNLTYKLDEDDAVKVYRQGQVYDDGEWLTVVSVDHELTGDRVVIDGRATDREVLGALLAHRVLTVTETPREDA